MLARFPNYATKAQFGFVYIFRLLTYKPQPTTLHIITLFRDNEITKDSKKMARLKTAPTIQRKLDYHATQPPSTAIVCPVTQFAASDAKNKTAPTTSSTSPTRPIGIRRTTSS